MSDDRKLTPILRRLDISIGRAFCQQTQRSGIEDVSGTNGHVIRFLKERENQDVYQRDLEREFGITRSTASRVLTLMEQKGLIVRSSVSHDARLKKLTLTPRANDYAALMQANGRAMDERLLTGFSEEERETLFSFLERMQGNVSRG